MTLATETDAVREYARNVGHEHSDAAWILSPFDTWERNPFYVGPPQPHPEDDYVDAVVEDGWTDELEASMLREPGDLPF